MRSMSTDGDWFDRIPKIELHIHLEGSIPIPALWDLIGKYGGHAEVGSLAELEGRFLYRDFDQFLTTWMWKNRFLREADDFAFIAEAVAAHLRDQEVRYAEMFYSPPDFADTGLSVGAITEAVRAGLDRVAGIRVALIADVVRNYGPDKAMRTVHALAEVRDQGVIGIGLGGAEAPFPPELFAHAFERARELGFHTTAHAGEAAGAPSIWGALRTLRVERIGHGTRAEEDSALIEYLAEHAIPLEMCPISNVRTAVVKELQDHPIRRYSQRGLIVTVNTDDPAMFQTSLAHEYSELVRVHGFTKDDIRGFILAAARASWLPEPQKSELLQNLVQDFTHILE